MPWRTLLLKKKRSGAVNKILKMKLFKIHITVWELYFWIYIKKINVLFHMQKTAYLYFFDQKIWTFKNYKIWLNLENIPRCFLELSHFYNFQKLISSEQKEKYRDMVSFCIRKSTSKI